MFSYAGSICIFAIRPGRATGGGMTARTLPIHLRLRSRQKMRPPPALMLQRAQRVFVLMWWRLGDKGRPMRGRNCSTPQQIRIRKQRAGLMLIMQLEQVSGGMLTATAGPRGAALVE